MRKFVLVVLVVLLAASILTGCEQSSQEIETDQQEKGVAAIVQNQPVPDLGGYSLERANLIRIMILRNQKIATYSYFFTITGTIIEVCPSQGFPFPYGTQLTAPEVYRYTGVTVPQAEINSLYSPQSADASWVLCVVDGIAVPTYFEEKIEAFPYRIKADIILEPITAPSIVDIGAAMPMTQTLPVLDTQLNGEPIAPSVTVTATELGLFDK